MSSTVLLRLLLALSWSAGSLFAQQNVGCGSLETQYALQHLANVSVGLSPIDTLRTQALLPLLERPRVSGTYGNVLARDHIKNWMRKEGWTVEEDSFDDNTPYGVRHFSNIITTLNPGRPRRLILACHYDSKLMFGPFPFVGATDSAVPCSLLMDSASQLREFFASKTRSASDLTLQFIFFDGEEAFFQWSSTDSLYGARHLANKWATTPDPNSPGRNYLQSIEALILLDLIGTSDTHFKNRYWQTIGIYDKLHNIETCLRNSGYLKVTTNLNPIPIFTSQYDFNGVEDDHLPFLRKGVPIVHLITTPFPKVWHTPLDNEGALDFDVIDNLARILRVFLVDLPL